MSNFSCKVCSTNTTFNFDFQSASQIVCPSCGALHGNTNGKYEYLNKKFIVEENFSFIGEEVNYNKKKYTVIGFCTKKSNATSYTWKEFILYRNSSDIVFLAQGHDYNAVLTQLLPLKFDQSFDQVKINGINYKSDLYLYDSGIYADVISASGVFFSDLTKSVVAHTFIEDYHETKFLSIEEYDDLTEYYLGNYIETHNFNTIFKKKRDQLQNQANNRNAIIKIFAALLLVATILFLGLNYFNFFKQTFKADNIYKDVKSAVVVDKSFELVDDVRNIKISGVSYITNTTGSPKVYFHLVNEQTNLREYSTLLNFYDNKINKANSFEILYCNVNAGKYHLEYTFSDIVVDPALALDFTIDYELIWGNDVKYLYFALFIFTCFVLAIYFIHELNNLQNGAIKSFTISEILKLNNHKILKFCILVFVIFTCIEIYVVSFKDCNQKAKVSEIENSTYTGSRSHYVYRTFSSGASHK